MSRECCPVQYALVAYVRSELGEFVEELRRELHPVHAHLPTHLTVLPPRPLQGSEADAMSMLHQRGRHGCALPGGTGRGGELPADYADGVHPVEPRRLQDARVARPDEPRPAGLSTNPSPTCRTLRWPNWMTTSAPTKCCGPAKTRWKQYHGSHCIAWNG